MNVAENSTYQVYGRKMINSVTIFQAAKGCIKNDSNEGWPLQQKRYFDFELSILLNVNIFKIQPSRTSGLGGVQRKRSKSPAILYK